jgi:hypothetical protein
VVVVASLAVALPAVACASGGGGSAARILDRTVQCRTTGKGYPDPLRTMAVTAGRGFAQATNGQLGTPQSVVAQIAFGVNGQDQVILSRVACAPTSLRIPFSRRGLRSGITDFGNKWQCPVPATILVRIRAEFRRAVTLSPAVDAPYLSIAKGAIVDGALTVTTKSRQPVFFATVGRGGKSSIFVAKPSCSAVKH